MLFGILPLLLVGLGLSFLLDGGAEDDPPPESDTLNLTPGDDVLDMGRTTASEINALAGNDTITSQESRPLVLSLGAGADVAELSNGFAEVQGGSGDDSVVMTDGALLAFLGFGNDTVEGIDAQVEAYGQGGDDLMSATQFDDTLGGGNGADTLFGGDGNDRLAGGLGKDQLYGDRGDDTLLGGQGDDELLDVVGGNDLLIGNTGNDYLETDGRGDTLYGYAGDDTLVGYASSASQNADPGAILDGGVGNDDLFGDLNTTMTGGDGQDDFTVISEVGSPEDPAVITDFDPTENDRIFLTITPEVFGDPRDGVDYEVTRQVAADNSGVEILVNGAVYVKLEGITTLEGWIVNVRENFI
jgi:Ca2+-binding RTX toxin-like protein